MTHFRKHLLFGSILVFVFTSFSYVSLAIFLGKDVYLDTKIPSDVILVLGAKAYHGQNYNPCLVSRVEHAVDLYKARLAPNILVSGGFDTEDNVNETETMKKIAVGLGVPESDILLEPSSTSTYENIHFSGTLMDSLGLHSAIIVSEPFHSPRAALVAEKAGLQYLVSPAVDSPCWTRWTFLSRYFLKEPLAVLLYKIEGKL